MGKLISYNIVECDKHEQPLEIWLTERVKRNSNAVILVTGDPGTGKTYSALSLAQAKDKEFTTARACFSLKDLIKLMMKIVERPSLYRGAVIIYEEPQEEQTNKRSFAYSAVQFTRLLSTFRSLNCILIMTSPRESQLQKDCRDYVDVWMITSGIDRENKVSYVKPLFLQRDEHTKRVYKKFMRVRRNGEQYIIPVYGFRTPTKDMIRFYESKKKDYLKTLFKKIDKNITRREQESETGICPQCNTSFGYWKGKDGDWFCRKCGDFTVKRKKVST